MELGALLGCCIGPRSSETIRATIRRRNRRRGSLSCLRARGLYRDPPPIPPEEGTWGTPSDVIETTTRVWAARPYWLRIGRPPSTETGVGERTSVGVKEGELFWSKVGDRDVHTNEQRPMSGTMTTSEERLLTLRRCSVSTGSSRISDHASRKTRHRGCRASTDRRPCSRVRPAR